jgi:hypothetical protein
MTAGAVLFIYAVAVGFVSAGLIGSGWALMTGARPRFQLLLEPSFFVPFRTMAVVFHAPLMVLDDGLVNFAARPAIGIMTIAASLGWSFLQGVFILTQIFGLQ